MSFMMMNFDGGKTYTLLAIVPRSAGYEAECGGNFEMGTEGDHQGFKKGRTKVLNFAKEYFLRLRCSAS